MALRLARRHRSRELDRPTVKQQLLGQRGFAGVRMGNDGEGAPSSDFVLEG